MLQSFDTPINNGIPLSNLQISWITSLLSLGGLVGGLIAGSLADVFGRKRTLLALAFPQIVSLSAFLTNSVRCRQPHVTFEREMII